jgi:hypothetical protein
MDASKVKTAMSRQRRRHRLAPAVESLEGRQLLTAHALTQVGVSEGNSNGMPTLLIMGTNKSDIINITDNGSGAAGNVTVTLGSGATYTSRTAISEIEVVSRAGTDQVSYTLTGELVAPQTVLVYLGSGKDSFVANVNGAINNPAGLDLEAYAGAGTDAMTINQSGQIKQGTFIPFFAGGPGTDTMTYNGTGPINGNAAINPAFSAGNGNQTIVSNYSGTIDGNYVYNMTVHGGRGRANITDNIHVGPGSVGTVGTSATSPALVKAVDGKAKIHYAVTLDPTANAAQVFAEVQARRGDTVERTANVVNGSSGTKDSVISS